MIKNLDTSCNQSVLLESGCLRRLIEIECERLQGFPDDWTKFGLYEDSIKQISKTQIYNMLGNAITVDVMKAIGKKY